MAGKNERQRRQARERYRRQQETRTARQRQVRKRWLSGISAVAAVGLIAALLVVFLPGGSGKKASASATKSPSASASASALAAVAEPAHHCTYTKATPVARTVSFPPSTPDYTASYQATINTNLGPITVNLLNSKATCTVNSFVHLAEAGYFNNTQCHRMVTSGIYVLQCGDPYATATTKLTCSATSKIGTGTPGYEFASENLTNANYPAGTVAMANQDTATPTAASSSSCTRTAPRGSTLRAPTHRSRRFLPGSISSRMWRRVVTRASTSTRRRVNPRVARRRKRSSLTA